MINEEKLKPTLNLHNGAGQRNSSLCYLDNSTSNHMKGQLSKFRDLDENVKGKVKFGDGSIVLIKGKGSIVLYCKNGEEKLLRDV